jgi:hypothetical protein
MHFPNKATICYLIDSDERTLLQKKSKGFGEGKWNGPEDKGEGESRWFAKDEIPLDEMWDDNRYWLYEMLEGNFVRKRFYFDENNRVQSHYDIKQKPDLYQQGGKNE